MLITGGHAVTLFGLFKPSIEKLEARKDVRGFAETLDASRDSQGREDAARALARVLQENADTSATESLIRALDDLDFKVRSEAAEALRYLPSAVTTSALCALIERGGGPPTRSNETDGGSVCVLSSAVKSLKVLRDEVSVPTLQQLQHDLQNGNHSASALSTFAAQMDELLALETALALRTMQSRDAIEDSFALIDAFEDQLTDTDIPEKLAEKLGAYVAYLRKDECIDLEALAPQDLIVLSRSHVPALRRACARVLRWKTQGGEPEVEKALLTLLNDRHDRVTKVAEDVAYEVARFSSNREFLSTAAKSSRPTLREIAQDRLANLAREEEARRAEEAKPEFQRSIERLVLNHDAASARQAIVLAESHLAELPPDLIGLLVEIFQEAYANTYYDGMRSECEAWRPVKPLAAGLIRQLAALPQHRPALRSAAAAAQKEYDQSWETDTAHEHAERFGWGATISLIHENLPEDTLETG